VCYKAKSKDLQLLQITAESLLSDFYGLTKLCQRYMYVCVCVCVYIYIYIYICVYIYMYIFKIQKGLSASWHHSLDIFISHQ
jgi:hypothetical protein